MKSFILRSIRTKITKILRFALFHCEYDGRKLRIFSVQNLWPENLVVYFFLTNLMSGRKGEGWTLRVREVIIVIRIK